MSVGGGCRWAGCRWAGCRWAGRRMGNQVRRHFPYLGVYLWPMRAVPVPHLLLAAIAERHGLVVLDDGRHRDHLAQVTGQPARWVVPQRSVP